MLPMIGKSQNTCLTAVAHTPNKTWQWIAITPTTAEYWLTFVGDTISRYYATVEVSDTTKPTPKLQSATLYNGSCSTLNQVAYQDSITLNYDGITQGQTYYLKLVFTALPSQFQLRSTFAQPKNDGYSCIPTSCDGSFVSNGDFLTMDNDVNSSVSPFPEPNWICAWDSYRETPQANTEMGYLDNGYAYMWGYSENGDNKGEGIRQNIYLPAGSYDIAIAAKLMGFSDNPCNRVIMNITNVGFSDISNSELIDPSVNALSTPTINSTNWALYTGSYTNTQSETRQVIVMPYQNTSQVTWVGIDNIHITPKPTLSVTQNLCLPPAAIFTLSAELCHQTIQSITWDFGDGNIVNSQPNETTISHIYAQTGNYNLTVTVYYQYFSESANRQVALTVPVYYYSDNLFITGNKSTCDDIANYTLENAPSGQNYQWTILPSNAGTIVSGHGTSAISIDWSSQNMDWTTPAFIEVYNPMCDETIQYRVWKCCSKPGSNEIVYGDASITNDITGGGYFFNGEMLIESNVTISNTCINMGPEAKILVKPPYSLTLNNTIVREGCNYMWDGIYAEQPTNTITTQNNTIIMGAFNAIVSERGAVVNASNTLFNLNLDAIIIKDHSGSNPLTVKNCRFYSTTSETGVTPWNLEAPYNYRRGRKGIYVKDMASVTVGNPVTTDNNKFSYIELGIDVLRSNVNIYNNTFANMTEIEEFTGIGIRINGNSSAQQTINIGGYNVGSSVYTNLFNNCNYGVKSLGLINLNILSNSVTNGYMGFVIDNNTSRNIIIRNNNVFMTHMGQGIYMTSIGNSRIFIDSNYVSASSLNTYAGIGVENVMPQVVHGVTIRNNKVVGSFKNGIILTNILKPTIMNPNATELYIPYLYKDSILLSNLLVSIPNINSAISVSGCTSTFLEENVIVKTDGFTTTTETRALRANGIYISTSTSNHLCNNKITNMGTGIRYNSNCKTARNYQNILTSNYYGFRLDNAAIGNQGYSVPVLSKHLTYDNQWITNYITTGRVQGSLSEATKWYYRTGTNYSLAPGTFSVPAGNFYTYQITPNQTLSCGYDGSIALGGSGGFMNSMSENFDNESETYVSDIEENQYYDITAAYRKYGSLVIESDDISNSISENELNPTNIPLFANAANQAAEGLINEALITNYNILPVNLIEQNMQTVNQIYLNSWAQGRFNLTDNEYNILLDIANQDYTSGGYGVFGAEVMTQRFEKNKTDKNQLNYHHIFLPDNHENEITLYPNPANGVVNISSLISLDNALVGIYTITGKSVLSLVVGANAGNLYTLNITGLKQGIYYCKIILSTGKNFNKKLIIY